MTVDPRANGSEGTSARDPGLAGAASSEAGALPADPDSICWCCGGPTAKRHCKIICTNCGFMRDCSDQ
jgi:hypothetical protein